MYKKLSHVEFPEYLGIKINMMPYVIGDLESIPSEYRKYRHIVRQCEIDGNEYGKVGYLTIHESIVKPGKSQRRPGVHTEKHPKAGPWGGGNWGGSSGLFMVSNIEGSTSIYNTTVEEPGPHGDCEHLVGQLGKPELMEANRMYWLTDATPHASLPVKTECKRQFFRMVTSNVFAWYAQHSTKNRLGIVAPVKIINTNKFGEINAANIS